MSIKVYIGNEMTKMHCWSMIDVILLKSQMRRIEIFSPCVRFFIICGAKFDFKVNSNISDEKHR